MTILVGCSGWSYDDWVGAFYPVELAKLSLWLESFTVGTPLTFLDRLEMTAELNALVARHYGLSREDLVVILESFTSFEEDPELENLKEIKWSDTLMRKFNGEVRRRVMGYFDALEKSPDHEGAV